MNTIANSQPHKVFPTASEANAIGFQHGKERYMVTSIEPIGEDMPALRSELEAHNREPAIYHAKLRLKSGKESKRGGIFYRSSKNPECFFKIA